MIILIILGEEYKWRSSSLCSFLHLPVTSSLLGPNILLSTLFSNTLIDLLQQNNQSCMCKSTAINFQELALRSVSWNVKSQRDVCCGSPGHDSSNYGTWLLARHFRGIFHLCLHYMWRRLGNWQIMIRTCGGCGGGGWIGQGRTE
jgi:hypothetical protein